MAFKASAGLIALILLLGGVTRLNRVPDVTIEAASPEQRELAEWALGRFEAVGLSLPPVIISFQGDDFSSCEGSAARAHLNQTPMIVKVCWVDPFIFLHELGHAWVAANLARSERESFMAMRQDVHVWSGEEVSWAQRGTEHAANVIAWGLSEVPFLVSRTYPNDPQSMIASFKYLTGHAPLHDGGEGVQLVDRSEFQHAESRPIESGH